MALQKINAGTIAVPYATTADLDASKGNTFDVAALGGNIVFAVKNLRPGHFMFVYVVQTTGLATTAWNGAGGMTVVGDNQLAATGGGVATVFMLVGVNATTAMLVSKNGNSVG